MSKITVIYQASLLLLTVLLLSITSITAVPQTSTGTLLGQVFDINNQPLKDVRVVVRNSDNGLNYDAVRTDEQGSYVLELLPAGEYDIIAELSGYQSAILMRFPIDIGSKRVIKAPPIILTSVAPVVTGTPATTSGPISQQVITAQANVFNAALRGNATDRFILALPLRGIRSFDTFAFLVPGVNPPPATIGANGPGIGAGIGTAGQFSVNGQRARANNFTIDGSDNNDQDVGVRRQGFTSTIPQSIESVQEFQITTLLADAETGRNVGGQVNIVSRSGESSLHGQFYNFFNDSALNARDFFDLTIPGGPNDGKNSFTRNQFGGVLSAPIIPNRMSLFTSLEQQLVNRSQLTNFAVPTVAERTRAFRRSGFIINQADLGIFKLLPLPNNPDGPYGNNTFSRILPASGEATLFNTRLDYQIRLFDRLSTLITRYNFADDDTRIPAIENSLNSSIDARTRTQNLALTINTLVSQRVSNQFRFSYGRTALNFAEVAGSPLLFQTDPDVNRRGGDDIDSQTGPIGRLVIAPFSSVGIDPFTFPQQRANNTFQIANTVVFSPGNKTFKFGSDVRRTQFNSVQERNYRAQISYLPSLIRGMRFNTFIGNGLDLAALDAASDIFQSFTITPDAALSLRFIEASLFANGNIRVHPRVTLDFGLRYEINTVPTDAKGRIERALALTPSDFGGNAQDASTQAFVAAFQAQRQILAGREKIYEGDHNNFAPRFGIAWDITGDGRTALRAGYGLFYDQILGSVVSQSRNIFPAFISSNFSTANFGSQIIGNNPIFLDADGIPLIRPGTLNTLNFPVNEIAPLLGSLINNNTLPLGFTLPDKNLRTPYVHQYSMTFERTLLNRYIAAVSYVGTAGRKLLRFRTPNNGASTPILFNNTNIGDLIENLSLGRPIPQLGAYTIFESSAKSNYNALQASLTRRTINGFGFQLAYTYSHTIDEVSDLFDLAGSYALAQDESGIDVGLRTERGDASFDVRHRFSAGWQYQLPFANGNLLLGGIELAGILTLQTGQPFTVNARFDVNNDGNLTDRLDNTNGLIPTEGGPTRISLAPNVTEFDLLSADAFRSGSVGRNTFRAAGIASLDLALTKRFRFTEQQSLTFRVEAFNLFNRSHFGIPVRVLGAPGFGSAVNTSLPARMIQFAVRYQF